MKTQAQILEGLKKFFPEVVTATTDRPPGGHVEALYDAAMYLLAEDKNWGQLLARAVEDLKGKVSALQSGITPEADNEVKLIASRLVSLGVLTQTLQEASNLAAAKQAEQRAAIIQMAALVEAGTTAGLEAAITALLV